MILVVSQHTLEHTTEVVMDWLDAIGAPYVRVNGEDLLNEEFTLSMEGETPTISLRSIDFSKIKTVWFRRWIMNANMPVPGIGFEHEPLQINDQVMKYRIKEFQTVSAIFNAQFMNKRVLGLAPCLENSPSKYLQLQEARKAGLRVPVSVITSSKEEVRKFLAKQGLLITKNIYEVASMYYRGESYATYTVLIDEEKIEDLPEKFAPSLFQQAVEKDFELRIFYLDGTCYAMAMFSSLDKQTSVDFRHYNFKRPNRWVPYKLSDTLSDQIHQLMIALGLKTGSLDFIVTPDNDCYFLEVNPGGQFGMVSNPCNYYLEKKVAEYLALQN